MRRFLVLGLVLLASLAWADSPDDLKACQAQLRILAQEVQRESGFYQLHLAQLLAEMRAQLRDARAQIEVMRQELARAGLKPAESMKP